METKQTIIDELHKRWVSKQEIGEMLGCDERAVRTFIAGLNHKLAGEGKCVLSSSRRRGYHIPNRDNIEDFGAALQAARELKGRAIAIFQRRKVLEDWIKGQTEPIDDEQLLFY